MLRYNRDFFDQNVHFNGKGHIESFEYMHDNYMSKY